MPKGKRMSVKQSKTMSALSHGWKPSKSGDVAKIPVGVAKHLHAEGAGQKYGAKHKESKKWSSRGYTEAHSSWRPKTKGGK